MRDPMLTVQNLRKTFKSSRWPAPALRTTAIDDISLEVHPGESVGIAGESGSGKSTLVGAICGLVRPDSGTIHLDGEDLYPRGSFDRKAWRKIQLVFQDPYTCLNPAMSVEENVAEPARFWLGASEHDARRTAREMLDLVGLGSSLWRRQPGTMSGGQQQRASIARALAAAPEMIILDESVSALDVSIQAQILELLLRLREERNLTYVLVSHDISVIRLVCDRVVVMQHGRIVEQAQSEDLTVDRVHDPYTRQLLSAVPSLAGQNG